MRRSHVESRARRYAARQYVSDTHSHKPDAKRPKPIVKDESEEEETASRPVRNAVNPYQCAARALMEIFRMGLMRAKGAPGQRGSTFTIYVLL